MAYQIATPPDEVAYMASIESLDASLPKQIMNILSPKWKRFIHLSNGNLEDWALFDAKWYRSTHDGFRSSPIRDISFTSHDALMACKGKL